MNTLKSFLKHYKIGKKYPSLDIQHGELVQVIKDSQDKESRGLCGVVMKIDSGCMGDVLCIKLPSGEIKQFLSECKRANLLQILIYHRRFID